MDKLILTLTIILSISSFFLKVQGGQVDRASNLTMQEKVSNLTKIEKNGSLESMPLMGDVSESRDFGITLILVLTVGFILLLPLFLILALIFFIPIPSIYYPPGSVLANGGLLVTGRRDKAPQQIMNRMMGPEGTETLRGILDSDICIQRISCEIMRASKGFQVDKWISRMINELPMGHRLKWKIKRAAHTGQNCHKYTCDPMSSIWKMLPNF